MKKLNQKIYFFILMLVSFSPSFGETNASVNQTMVYEGNPIILTIESSQGTHQPDLSPLTKDFNITSQGTSSQINIINGQRSFKKTWDIKLLAKRLGEVEIPAIQVGDEKSSPIMLNVTVLPPEVKAETAKHIFIESFIGTSKKSLKKETYVQQQIPYTIKLFYDSHMLSGEISPLKVENAVVEQLGRDKRYNARKGGKKFSVIEKHFVISPEKSGALTIPATTVKGKVALSGGDSQKLRRRMDDTDMLNRFFNDLNGFRNDPFFNDPFGSDFFRRPSRGGPSKPFSVSTKAIEVNVLPVPSEFTGQNWLPAEGLSFNDSWAKTPPELKVGEPVTRTLILQAKGLAGSQIPELKIPKPADMKMYPEPAKTETRHDGKTVYGIQQIDISYIPNKSGDLVIPEIKLDWWNVQTKKQQTLVLPKWTLNVTPSAITDQAISQQNRSPTTTPVTIKELNPNERSSEALIDSKKGESKSWSRLLIFFAVLGIVLMSILAYYFFKAKTKLQHRSSISKNTLVSLKNNVLKACKENNNHAAAKSLLKFIQAQWQDSSILNLSTLIRFMKNDTGQDAAIINELEKSLYAPSSMTWDGKRLHDLMLKGIEKNPNKEVAEKEFLKPLYPI